MRTYTAQAAAVLQHRVASWTKATSYSTVNAVMLAVITAVVLRIVAVSSPVE
jgi:hypothetical protein